MARSGGDGGSATGAPGRHGFGGGRFPGLAGGGYSGAGAYTFGGGGGSFDAGANPILMAGFRAGNGEVDITELPAAPEPASLALLATGLLTLPVLRRKHRAKG